VENLLKSVVSEISPIAWLGLGVVWAGLFANVVHELGHALTARWFGLRILKLVFRPWSGYCLISREKSAMNRSHAQIAFEDMFIAAAGPGANLVVGALLLSGLLVPIPPLAVVALVQMGFMNLLMGVLGFVGISKDPVQDAQVMRRHYRQWRSLLENTWTPRSQYEP